MIQTLSEALSERGYDVLTPVQEAVTDPELAEKDLLVSAQTGSGKTVGFGLAIGPTILDAEGRLGPAALPLALIVAPTRELAFQVTRELEWLYARAGARVTSCVGGMDMRDERRALERGAHIVVGTPGRLRDHIQRGSLDMSALRAVVLDEADEMLDLGFREDLEFMLGEAPEDRRTLLFSATVPPMIATLAQHYQRDAVRVTTLNERSQHADIAYQVLKVAPQDVENAVINVLRFHEAQNAIVFANTRATVNRLTARLGNRGFSVVCLSGELSQAERSHALQAMRDGRARVCVATDVAARGIDLPNLELVVHAELPSNAEGLLHRSGRTGRAGRKGISALVVPPRILKKAERLLKFAKVQAEWISAPDADEILARDEERLLADPAWSQEPSESEAEFAARLLAAQSPETIAAAYLRLYRTRHSAPEELAAPDARPAPKERAPFGPSTWFALSVGRDDRAEARWLLPLLCRAGGLDKDAIGAIRVQQSETFVEIAEARAGELAAVLGADGTLDEKVKARRIEGTPDFGARPPREDRPARDDRPARGPRPERAERTERAERAERQAAPAAEEGARKPRHKSSGGAPRPDAPSRPAPRRDDAAGKPAYAKGPRRDGDAGGKPAYGKGPRRDGDAGGKPSYGKGPRRDGDAGGKPSYGKGPRRDGDAGGKPAYGKGPRRDGDAGGKPSYGKGPRRDGDAGGKPSFGKGPRRDGDAGGKPSFGKGPRRDGDAKPKPQASASDVSKRFTPPGRPASARKSVADRNPGGQKPPKRRG